jgi:hypothetical protein
MYVAENFGRYAESWQPGDEGQPLSRLTLNDATLRGNWALCARLVSVQIGAALMPVYSFRLVPDDGEEFRVVLPSDAAALAEANRTLGDLLFDAAAELRAMPTRVQVTRDDGVLIADLAARPPSRGA